MIPKVSVIVATYRRDSTLRRALESLARQTHTDFEIILVDDNAELEWNNKVKEIYFDFLKERPQLDIKYIINKTNQGSAKTRNIGIEMAEGEYITFLDDDDIYLPQKIERQIEGFIATDADYGIMDLKLYDEKDKLIDIRTRSYINSADSKYLLKYHLMYHMTGTDTMMFKKEYLKKIGGFDPIDVGDEFYLMQKAITNDGNFSYLPECLVKAYVHTGEGGLSSGESKIEGEKRLFDYKRKFFVKVDKKTKRYIIMRHHAVLAYAFLRWHRPFECLKELMLSFFAAPIASMRLLLRRKVAN